MIHTPRNDYGASLPIWGWGVSQNIEFNAAGGSATANGTSFSTNVEAVIITATAGNDFRFAAGVDAVADANSSLVPTPCMLAIQMPRGGGVLSVLSNTAATGSICVTEVVSKPSHFVVA